jgi:membrane protein YqaA with SNARE-associated domain
MQTEPTIKDIFQRFYSPPLPAGLVCNSIINSMTENDEQTEANSKRRWRGKVIPVLSLLLVIAITAALFIYRDRVAELGNYGYLGVFVISLVCSATIILPVPGMLLIFALGATFNPVFVGLVAAFGGTLGEITGYTFGYSGRRIIGGDRVFIRAEKWIKRWGMLTIFVFSLVPPLPIDVLGIVTGSLRFPLWKFLLGCFLGKAILYTGMAFTGAWGWEIILPFFS